MAMHMELYATEGAYLLLVGAQQPHHHHHEPEGAGRRKGGRVESRTNSKSTTTTTTRLLEYGDVMLATTALSLVLWFLLDWRSRKRLVRQGAAKTKTTPSTSRAKGGDDRPQLVRRRRRHVKQPGRCWKWKLPPIPAVLSHNNHQERRRASKTRAHLQEPWFPGALRVAPDLVRYIRDALAPFHGEDPGKSPALLLATSLCGDAINRPFLQELRAAVRQDRHFNLGGLAGVPFGGVTAFEEMAQQIPNGGSCLVVYGPHVGIDPDGTLGTVDGRDKCCASAIAACLHVQQTLREQQQQQQPSDNDPSNTTQQQHPEDDATDAQQTFVQNMLVPFANRLQCSEEIMAELPYVLYDAQTELMEKILQKGCRQVAGDGKIALLGGIHINTPKGGMSDYFLPLRFDLFDNQGTIVANLRRGPPRAPLAKIASTFPRALLNDKLLKKVTLSLAPFGYGKHNSLLCTSFCSCCNQINRPLEQDLCEAFGEHFNIGGLAGFAFGGATGFAAMAMRIPDGGNCLIVYGPHVGVDSQGHMGTVDGRGRSHHGACCSSGRAALDYVESVTRDETQADRPVDPLDAQQTYVGDMLLPYADQLAQADDVMVELPFTLFQAQDKLVQKIVRRGRHLIPGRMALLGGIQINTPDGVADYFLPLRFEVLKNMGNVVVDLLYERKVKDMEGMM